MMDFELTWTVRVVKVSRWPDPNEYECDDHRSQVVDFGIRDEKGRAIGTYARIYCSPEGNFSVSTNATRDGKNFGAIPRSSCADTLEAAKALAAKKVRDAYKRAAKVYGGSL